MAEDWEQFGWEYDKRYDTWTFYFYSKGKYPYYFTSPDPNFKFINVYFRWGNGGNFMRIARVKSVKAAKALIIKLFRAR